jgi:hypothetical protein
MAILKTHYEHNIAVTVAGELCLVVRFLSLTTALPFLKKNFLCHFTGLVSLLSEYPSYFSNAISRMMDNGRLAVEQKTKVLLFLKERKSYFKNIESFHAHLYTWWTPARQYTDSLHFKEEDYSVLEGRLPDVVSSLKAREL